MEEVVIKPTGDSALAVEFQNIISISVNQKVHTLVKVLEEDPIPGIVEMVPTYRSVMVYYRPEQILYGDLKEAVLKRLDRCGRTGTCEGDY